MENKDPLIYFRFKPLKSAKVSEISESTADSTTPLDEQVHFHIGNPIQDSRLLNLYFKNVTGISLETEELSDSDFDSKIEESDWDISQKKQIELIYNCIKNSAPYMPRGGYHRSTPPELIKLFQSWLVIEQSEPLEYNFGDRPGNRECIIALGGIWESLRILYFSLNKYLEFTPAQILLFNSEIPNYASQFSSLVFQQLPDDEHDALKTIVNILKENETKPTFLVLGNITAESTRRALRKLSLRYPLLFIEINNAPNHLSIAREAKMLNRVLRFITPAIFSDDYDSLSIVFILGNGDILKVLETVHFELKGTPSATEVELLTYFLKSQKEYKIETSPGFETTEINNRNSYYEPDDIATRFTRRANNILEKSAAFAESVHFSIEKRLATINEKRKVFNHLPNTRRVSKYVSDKLMHLSSPQILDRFLQNKNQPEWYNDLSESFLSSFLSHHSEYDIQYSSIVSGSARTAMSLLGYHCGIDDVIIPDLSWTYEHCFPNVTAVTLSSDFSVNVTGFINTVQKKIKNDPSWKKHGAVILNNPHNASGSIIDELKLIKLIEWLLERDVFIIDDLSYQNVLPRTDINGPRTLKQIVNDLSSNGSIRTSKKRLLITVHSLSKTDCFAGARLAVIEILHPQLLKQFNGYNSKIKPNVMALLTAYLFYRNYPELVNEFWIKRNEIFSERMASLSETCRNLPDERNPFDIEIIPPEGSMYPRLVINKLPSGISLDWLSSGLALEGIGLIPFSTFARTAEGFTLARKTFRLTLGGKDNATVLSRKTRRVLIDLNRFIANETSKYNKKKLNVRHHLKILNFGYVNNLWNDFSSKLQEYCKNNIKNHLKHFSEDLDSEEFTSRFLKDFFPDRISTFNQKIEDAILLSERIINLAQGKESNKLISFLEKEFYKEKLTDRANAFRGRLYDRTVHPTQMYSLNVETQFNSFVEYLLNQKIIDQKNIINFAHSLFDEFLGKNVAISSIEEASESICDLKSMIWTDEFSKWNCDEQLDMLLSFWGDWDGSTRPSGQGHRLVASVVMENVKQLSEILQTLLIINENSRINTDLYKEVEHLHKKNIKFWNLLNNITSLTNILEKRYQSILPTNISVSKIKSLGMRFHVVPDPYESLWQHNDKLERRMQKLRDERRQMLEYYFSLNKQLRKTLSANIQHIKDSLNNTQFALRVGSYRSLLKRFVLTPRIHQKLITANDQFSIDTTVHNLVEINDVAGRYGNPGLVLALQVSMSKEPEAFIALDRKIKSKIEEVIRDNPNNTHPLIWIIPLFEDVKSVQNIPSYLDRLWDYAIQSRHIDQKPEIRFTEMICELFIAGSDLSQQASQTAGAYYFKEAKYAATRWLAERGLVGKIRIKLGSGEPMQRQGGYYFPKSGEPAFLRSKTAEEKLNKYLRPSTKESVKYARSPLQGVMASGDLRTFQSNIAEQLRLLPIKERARLIFHIKESQRYYESELYRAAEPLLDTRLQFHEKGLKEIERLTKGKDDEEYKQFVNLVTKNFSQILYGLEEDVIGIHVVSYFISRTVPSFRDRPTVRPSQEIGEGQGKRIIDRISRTIPLSRHGTLLRAIGHNRAQTAVLGINQLTTGLFRALREFIEKQASFEEGIVKIADRILPYLPVQEILHTLRIYHDPKLTYINKLKEVFPPGNSAFLILREDNDCLKDLIHLVQKEMLRRQGLNIKEFFDGKYFNLKLLPTLRPDIAVLLQQDLFNIDITQLTESIDGSMDDDWQNEVQYLLKIPTQVHSWRKRIWRLIEDPIRKQVESFNELALAINTLSIGEEKAQTSLSKESSFVSKISTQVSELLKDTRDDSMRHFLIAVVQYIDRVSQSMIDVPIEIIRVLRDIEKIVQIEQHALSKGKQDLLRFYVLQIARICGENG